MVAEKDKTYKAFLLNEERNEMKKEWGNESVYSIIKEKKLINK
jgi:hypothetical protein